MMKKRSTWFSLFIALVLLFSLSGQVFAHNEAKIEIGEDGRVHVTIEFDDLDEAAWAIEHISKMSFKQIFRGYEDGTFRPNQPVKRVEAIVTAVRLMGLEEEAMQKPDDIQLHFKDANQIDKKFSWAKGYIAVALEQGLFDTSEDRVQPEAPASRVWAASLLVRALGLQSEALDKMTQIPDFKDAKAIPAGAVGYINVAVERGIITGYGDQTFQPNKKVTRAEMAAILDRTNDDMNDKIGAATVIGTIQSIQFTSNEDDADETSSYGTIVVKSFNDDVLTYAISSDLKVQHNDKFITADQLRKDDIVSLIVKENIVTEATLLSKDITEEIIAGIYKLEIEIELEGKDKFKFEYKNKRGKVKAEIEREYNDSSKNNGKAKGKGGKKNKGKIKDKIKGGEALAAIEVLLEKAALTADMSKQEILQRVLTALGIDQDKIKELEIEIKFTNGKKVEIEID